MPPLCPARRWSPWGWPGCLLLVAGRLGLGQLFKYIPLPVLAGFTNGIAASLFLSAGQILLGQGFGQGRPWSLADLHPVSFVVGVLTVVICLRPCRLPGVRHLPAVLQALVVASAAHYLLVGLFGLGHGPLIADWMPSPAGPAVPLVRWHWAELARGEWWLIGKFALAMAMAIALETLATAAHLDAETGQRSAGRAVLGRIGLTNLLLAPLMIPVAGSLGRSVALLSGGARSRWAHACYALCLGGLISLAFPLVAALPQAVIAGVLIAVARNMVGNGARQGLVEWRALQDGPARRRVAADWAVMLLVAAITVVDSFMMGLVVGTVAAMALFIRDQSRAVVRSVRFGDAVSSPAGALPARPREVQRKYGKEIAVFEVEGILFFGSVERLVQRMDHGGETRRRDGHRPAPGERYRCHGELPVPPDRPPVQGAGLPPPPGPCAGDGPVAPAVAHARRGRGDSRSALVRGPGHGPGVCRGCLAGPPWLFR